VEKLKLSLPLLWPTVDDSDQCVALLSQRLAAVRGVEEAHITRSDGHALLCLHYDPNLLSLERIRRLAEETGAELTSRYRHETMQVLGMDAADAAEPLTDVLQQLDGMLHANVNYAAGLISVAYDTQMTSHAAIEQAVRRMGYALAEPGVTPLPTLSDDTVGCCHSSAPASLPHWLQERWTFLLVALAGIFLLAGWLGEQFLGLPAPVVLICFLLSYLAGGYDIATHALPSLLRGKFDTDVLMLAAAAGAALLGAWAEGAFLLFLFALGHAGEHYALDRARNAVNALGELMPRTAHVRRGSRIEELPVDAVQVGDIALVRPGERAPVDGVVVLGESAVDQSPITGESMPVHKTPGAEIFAGTINQSAALDVRVTRLAKDNTLSRVLQMVQEAQSQQSPSQRFAERFTSRFVPAVLALVALVIVVPPLAGWMPLSESFYRGMLLLVAASPCALAIGTPAAVLAGIAQAARNGVLIKGGVHLENLGGLRVMAFDKTGTLTEGRFQVTDVISLNGSDPGRLLSLAAAVEQQSTHPLAEAVVRHAVAQGLAWPAATGLENLSGRGVRALVDGQPTLIGSLRLMQEEGDLSRSNGALQTVQRLEEAGKTTMLVAVDGQLHGILALADTPRPGVEHTLHALRCLGMRHLVMLTGDNPEAAQRLGQAVGVTDVRAGLLPEQKLEAIKALAAEHGQIAMIGDGVNDAPALAAATVGIAMGGAGTAVALETADVALMADDLSRLPFAVGLSRASRAIIRQNLAIALSIIVLLIMTSVLGLVQLGGAVILHEGSTIVVVLNALRLLRFQTSPPAMSALA
jgi:Cd2+/Zn2+-exporting ATPase